MVWSINPYPCSIHGPSSLLAILYASLGWITLPRETWWNIFQTKSSDSRAPSLGALDRGRSWDLVSCHGFQANTTERGLCDCAVDTRFERKMQTSCKLSIRSLLLNWFLTMIWYLALCAMWVTKSGTSGRGPLDPQAASQSKNTDQVQCIAVQATVEAFVFWSDTQVPQCWPSAIQG